MLALNRQPLMQEVCVCVCLYKHVCMCCFFFFFSFCTFTRGECCERWGRWSSQEYEEELGEKTLKDRTGPSGKGD